MVWSYSLKPTSHNSTACWEVRFQHSLLLCASVRYVMPMRPRHLLFLGHQVTCPPGTTSKALSVAYYPCLSVPRAFFAAWCAPNDVSIYTPVILACSFNISHLADAIPFSFSRHTFSLVRIAITGNGFKDVRSTLTVF